MENSKNEVTLEGYAGSDPVITKFSETKCMARLSIARNEFYKNANGEPVNETHWFNLVFWNKKVSLIDGLVKKGTRFCITGKLSANTFTDKKNEKRTSTEIIVSTVEIRTDEPEPTS